jgi:polar amino acid transport system permease protein
MMSTAVYSIPFLLNGLAVTVTMSLLVVVLSLFLGGALGMAVTYGPRPLKWTVRLFSDIVRGIPILVLIFFVFYGLPAIGINLPNFAAATVALVVYKTAQTVEYVRGAVQSIHDGQTEAAKSIGLTFEQRMAYVVLPQAIRRFLPPWINGVADAVKGTALVSLLGVTDLMHSVQQVVGRTYDPIPLYVLGAVIYFMINYGLSSLSRYVEGRYAYIRD